MSNKAAWITAGGVSPLKVDDAPMPKAGPGEIVIKNAAVGLNPIDWKIQAYDFFIQKYPNVLGANVAGTVYDIGNDVQGFKKGQRVIGHCVNLRNSNPAEGAFQLFSLCLASVVAPIPDSLPFAQASAIPIAVSVAALTLYSKDIFDLPLPKLGSHKAGPPANGPIVLLIGGSSSVGVIATQLAVSSDLIVFATSSPQNHCYIESLGAAKTFDRDDSKLASDIITAVKASGSKLTGIFDTVSDASTAKLAFEVALACPWSSSSKKVALTVGAPEGVDVPAEITVCVPMSFVLPEKEPEITKAIWGEFVPQALKSGQFKAEPKAEVIKGGLESIQSGLNTLKQGISAKKIVVEF